MLKYILVAFALLFVVELAVAKKDKPASWIKGENTKWPRWGSRKSFWLKREIAEARRDVVDARTEVNVVAGWGKSFVGHKDSSFSLRIRNRKAECGSFERLRTIRRANFLVHKAARLAILNRRRHSNPLKGHKKRSQNPKRSVDWRLKYSSHARMYIVSKGRLRASKVALLRCQNSVKKLRNKKRFAHRKAQAVSDAANDRAKKHLKRAIAFLRKLKRRLALHLEKVKARVAKYKTHYFHRCRRTRRYKYKCYLSTRHGPSSNSRRPFRFFKCFYNSANANGARYICYK